MSATTGYYLWLEEKPQGPFSTADIRAMTKTGAVSRGTLWSREGEQEWKAAQELREVWEESKPGAAQPSAEQLAWRAKEEKMREERRLWSNAEVWDGWSMSLIVLGAAGLVGALGMLMASLEGWYWAATGGGGFLLWGVFMKLVAQVIYVRAGIEEMNARERAKD
jgi:hypothetical protein